MKNIWRTCKIIFTISSALIVLLGIYLIVTENAPSKIDYLPYILVIVGLIGVLTSLFIKPLKSKDKVRRVLLLLQCLSFIYGVIYILCIFKNPEVIVNYLRLIPVLCAFAYVEIMKRNIKKAKREIN